MLIRIKKATYLCDYKLKILFSNGKTKVVDFEGWIFERKGNIYLEPLKDMEFFKKFDLDESKYTIYWPNGADFCPDVLYEVGKEIRTPHKPARPTSARGKIHRKKRRSSKV